MNVGRNRPWLIVRMQAAYAEGMVETAEALPLDPKVSNGSALRAAACEQCMAGKDC